MNAERQNWSCQEHCACHPVETFAFALCHVGIVSHAEMWAGHQVSEAVATGITSAACAPCCLGNNSTLLWSIFKLGVNVKLLHTNVHAPHVETIILLLICQ